MKRANRVRVVEKNLSEHIRQEQAAYRESMRRKIESEKMKPVTQDEWAEFLNQYDCYAREPDPLMMEHIHNVSGEILGRVVYTANDRRYFIHSTPFARKKAGA